jgi:signal transduction histidine kinase
LTVYLLAIFGPTLVLLYLGVVSLYRQRQALEGLATANMRLLEGRVIDGIEARATEFARACLLDVRFSTLVPRTMWSVPESVHALRRRIDEIRRNHAICGDVFVLAGPDVRFPQLDEPLPRASDALLAGEPRASGARVRALLADAEVMESAERYPAAAQVYSQAARLAVTTQVRALALARIARCQTRAGDELGAARSWDRLAAEYPDSYDLAWRPHALVAGVELAQLAAPGSAGGPRPGDPRAAVIRDLQRDLAGARWHLSPGQAEYFAQRLDEASGTSGGWETSPLFEHFAVGQAAKRVLQSPGSLEAGRVYTTAVKDAGRDYQLYYVRLTDAAGEPLVLGMAADLAWARSELPRAVARDLGLAQSRATLDIVPAGSGGTPFRTVFPFWALALGTADTAGGAVGPQALMFGGTIVGVLAVLVLGVVLLVRDVARDSAVTRLRSELVSGVSHELKTPLSVIRVYAETLANDPDADRRERSAHYSVILHESERLTVLIDRVLEFSRLERGARRYVLEPQSIGDLARGFVQRYRPYLAHLGFTVSTTVESDLPAVRADAHAVTEALVNLVDNAVKYSGLSTSIELRVRRRGGQALLEVQDYGIGMTAEERRRLFEPFYRANRTSGRGGYGLGLYLVAHIVQAHSGTIEIESTPDRGTCVRIVLPGVDAEGQWS